MKKIEGRKGIGWEGKKRIALSKSVMSFVNDTSHLSHVIQVTRVY